MIFRVSMLPNLRIYYVLCLIDYYGLVSWKCYYQRETEVEVSATLGTL